MGKIKFTVYKHQIVDKKGNLITKPLIVLVDNSGAILAWTDFHRYARNKKRKSSSIYSSNDNRCKIIALLLNYVFFDMYHVTRLNDITPDMIRSFIEDYGLLCLPNDTEDTHRNEKTVNTTINIIIDFITFLSAENPECKTALKDLFRTEDVFDRRQRRYIEKQVPNFEVHYYPNNRPVLRDLPERPFQIIMNEITVNHRRILMLAAAGAFAGLRPSEACNMRRVDSPLGPGIIFSIENGVVTDILIDLTEEKNLRSDMIRVGKIKRERSQKVYPAFIETFMDCYNLYMKYIAGSKYETEYGALTNTSFGKAYTYPSYAVEFQKVVQACIPVMLSDSDPETVNYGHLLMEHRITPHIFRHWYTVKVTQYVGGDPGQIEYWRGDKSAESSLTYQQNKSELTKQARRVTNEIFNYSLWKASHAFEEKNA